MIFNKENWTQCGKPRKGDEVLNPSTGKVIGTVDHITKDGRVYVNYDPNRPLYRFRPEGTLLDEHWEFSFERGALTLRRVDEPGETRDAKRD